MNYLKKWTNNYKTLTISNKNDDFVLKLKKNRMNFEDKEYKNFKSLKDFLQLTIYIESSYYLKNIEISIVKSNGN